MYDSSLIASTGTAKSVVNIEGEILEVYSYLPSRAAVTGILFLFDGIH
jgi:hypothetical protein